LFIPRSGTTRYITLRDHAMPMHRIAKRPRVSIGVKVASVRSSKRARFYSAASPEFHGIPRNRRIQHIENPTRLLRSRLAENAGHLHRRSSSFHLDDLRDNASARNRDGCFTIGTKKRGRQFLSAIPTRPLHLACTGRDGTSQKLFLSFPLFHRGSRRAFSLLIPSRFAANAAAARDRYAIKDDAI